MISRSDCNGKPTDEYTPCCDMHVNERSSGAGDFLFPHISGSGGEAPGFDHWMLRPTASIPEPGVAMAFASTILRPAAVVFVMVRGCACCGGRIEPGRPGYTMGAFFDRLDEFACELTRVHGVTVNISPNPLRHEGGRLRNRLGYLARGDGAHIDDVLSLRWIYLDIDPSERGGNATTGEHEACQRLRGDILAAEPAIAAASLWGSSGNGAYILIRVEMENTDENRAVVGAFQKALARKYRTDDAVIDTQWNPAKLVSLPGSRKCKYPHSPDRPRRVVACEPLDVPREVFNVRAWLDAARVPIVPRAPRFLTPAGPVLSPSSPRRERDGDVIDQAREWLRRRPPAIEGQGGRKHTYKTICVVLHGWELGEADTMGLIAEWNRTCRPPWNEWDLRSMVADASRDRRFGSGFMRPGKRRRRQRRQRADRGVGLPSSFGTE